MKRLFYNKKIIAFSTLVVFLITIIVLSLPHQKNEIAPTESKSNVIETSKDIVIDTPVNYSHTDGTSSIDEIKDDRNALTPDEKTESVMEKNTDVKAETNDTPETEASKPSQEEDNNSSSGIQIGGNTPAKETYNCGCTNHHCQNAEFHASLLNRELDGCPYCGSHSCPSFYSVNEWGYTKYDPSLCPKYSVQTDFAKYCSNCGRKMWSPDNPAGCFSYLQDTQCECGEFVPANTCHHH